jgi:hypothetical protein
VQRRAVGQDQRAASTDSWLWRKCTGCITSGRLARGRQWSGTVAARALDNGPQCRYFRGTDTWEAYAAGAVHSEESAAAVSNMQQRQSAGFQQYSRGIAERVLAMCGFKGGGALEDGMSDTAWAQSARSQPPACWSRLPAGHWPI